MNIVTDETRSLVRGDHCAQPGDNPVELRPSPVKNVRDAWETVCVTVAADRFVPNAPTPSGTRSTSRSLRPSGPDLGERDLSTISTGLKTTSLIQGSSR